MKKMLLLAAFSVPAYGAVCNPRTFHGVYGFQLSGDTTISGDKKQAVSIGRLVFDGSGGVSGYSSVNYAGFLLGNPTTGTYEAHTDCSVTWSLQDDSGAYQHFGGTMTGDAKRVVFAQTDPGGPGHGSMVLTPQACTASALQQKYRFSVSGSYTPMEAGQSADTISVSGKAEVQGGKLALHVTDKPVPGDGTFDVDGDCVVTMDLNLPPNAATGAATTINLRGMLVDDGKEILAIQTDPGAAVTARFIAEPVPVP